jgi:hypothetical protein
LFYTLVAIPDVKWSRILDNKELRFWRSRRPKFAKTFVYGRRFGRCLHRFLGGFGGEFGVCHPNEDGCGGIGQKSKKRRSANTFDLHNSSVTGPMGRLM